MTATISTFNVCFQQANQPTLRQAQQWAAGDDNPAVGSLTFSMLAHSSIVVFVGDMNLNGNPTGSGTPDTVTISDSQGGTYTNLGYVTDSHDWDAMQTFVRTNVSSGSITVTCHWVTNQWHGLAVAEISGISASPTVTYWGNLNGDPALSTDTITTGTQALGTNPALVVALAYNATDISTSEGYPSAGTGFTSALTGWNWQGKEGTSSNNVAQLESKYFSNPGTIAATFTPRVPGPNAEWFLASAVAFQ